MRRTFVSGTLFVCLWAVLTFLAPIRSVREAEATTAMLAASLAAAEFDAGLRTAKAHRVTFAAPLPEAESARSLAEAQGLALAARAADAEALTFLTHARQIGMSPRGWLALARLCAGSDGASAALEQATGEAVAIGGVPVAVLARLIDARGGNVRAKARDLADALVRGTLAVPGFAAPAVLDELLATDGSLRADAGVRALLAALDAWLSRGPADWPPTIPRRTGQDVVLLPSGADEVCLLLPEEVARLRERSAARAAASYPAVLCRSTSSSDESADESTGDGTRALAEAVDALAGRWLAEPNGTLVSTWLTRLSWLLLALGALAIVSSQVALARVAKRELRLARLRSDFVDLVSHELRTPLSAMSMRAEMLASGTVPDDKLPHYLHTLHLDVRRLADQVQRVLDFARLESRPALELRRTTARVAVARGVRAGLSALRPVGQSLRITVARDLPAIELDLEVIARALRNLLANAARYAPPASEVEIEAGVAGADALWIEVRDRGPGVPVDERATIFEPFQRGHHGERVNGGSGLGLALVARAATLHGGRVEVRGRLDGDGACFRLTLPLRAAASRRRAS